MAGFYTSCGPITRVSAAMTVYGDTYVCTNSSTTSTCTCMLVYVLMHTLTWVPSMHTHLSCYLLVHYFRVSGLITCATLHAPIYACVYAHVCA